MKNRIPFALALFSLTAGLASVSTQQSGGQAPAVYLVATGHLDTQWNWTVQDTIRDYIPKTTRVNFAYFEKHPDYVFSWEGAIHYMWLKEYYPAEWAKLQQYVAK